MKVTHALILQIQELIGRGKSVNDIAGAMAMSFDDVLYIIKNLLT